GRKVWKPGAIGPSETRYQTSDCSRPTSIRARTPGRSPSSRTGVLTLTRRAPRARNANTMSPLRRADLTRQGSAISKSHASLKSYLVAGEPSSGRILATLPHLFRCRYRGGALPHEPNPLCRLRGGGIGLRKYKFNPAGRERSHRRSLQRAGDRRELHPPRRKRNHEEPPERLLRLSWAG